MSLTDKLTLWTLIVTAIGVFFALVGIAVAVWTLNESAKVAKRQFFVTVRSLLANYDDIHAKVRPHGDWAIENEITGPARAEEWARLELYMGTFEYCETLIRNGYLDEEEFCKAYGYRLGNIVANRIIVEEKLIKLGAYWEDFCKLCRRCGIQPVIPEACSAKPDTKTSR
jgi:hypothetical protein